MNTLPSRPAYKYQPIASIRTLARVLNVDHGELISIADNAEKFWKPGKKQTKSDGSVRITHDANDPLKQIHSRVKDRILVKVLYPSYIFGGIASDEFTRRDYIEHARVHTKSKFVLSEDIANFFPNTGKNTVFGIWRGVFGFHPEVSEILSALTTHNGSLPQGWITSNHLANLALWKYEERLVTFLEKSGYSYSRFVDDITVSSGIHVHDEAKTELVGEVYGFIKRCGYHPKRTKHDLSTSGGPMKVVGLNVNGNRASKPKDKRRETRALVDHCVKFNPCARNSLLYKKMWNEASGKVGLLKQLHPVSAKKMRDLLSANRPIQSTRKTSIKKKVNRRRPTAFSD